MHRRIAVFLFSACMVLSGCTAAAQNVKNAGSSLTILQATDLHYLSPSLHDDGAKFKSLMANGDGKMSEYSVDILNALVEKVLNEKPDVFLLSGDLTFNGERVSLQEVKTALQKIEAAGIPVCVIPGNHDIAYPYAYSYHGDTAVQVSNVSQQDFQDLMKEFGYEDGIARDASSFSYVYPLSKDVWLLAMDANTEADPGDISEETLVWIKQQLQKASQQNIHVITMSHQNVLKQNERLYNGYVIEDYEAVNTILKQYGVTLNLSGHSHLEHVAIEDGLTDACTESIALYPIQYGQVAWYGDGNFEYTHQSLGILQAKSEERFDGLMRVKIEESLASLSVSDEIREEMVQFSMEVNRKYFTGDTEGIKALFDQPGWQLWQKYGSDTPRYRYLDSIREAQ